MTETDKMLQKLVGNNPELKRYADDVDMSLDIAVKVRKLRESLGMTQAEFAELVCKPQSTIGRLETGVTNVKLDTLLDIAKASNTQLKLEFI